MPQIVAGALIGGTIGAIGAICAGKSVRDIASAFVGGAITGGLATATCGMSLGAQIAGSAMAKTVGYCAEKLVAGEPGTATGLATSAMSGASCAMTGAIVGKAARIICSEVAFTSKINRQRVFWSGLGKDGAKIAEQWAVENGGETLEMYLKNNGINAPNFIDNPEFWNNASENFAKSASGDVKALVGPYSRPNSIWNTIEKPILQNNVNVTSIIEINPLE